MNFFRGGHKVKRFLIYIAGCLLIAPCFLGVVAGNILITLLAVMYGVVLASSPTFSDKARKFWRAWHRENYRIVNYFFK